MQSLLRKRLQGDNFQVPACIMQSENVIVDHVGSPQIYKGYSLPHFSKWYI